MKETLLPWMDPLSAGHLVVTAVFILVLYNVFEYFFKRNNITMRRGTLAIISNSAWALCLNFCIFTLAFWYWAVPLSLALSAIFIVIIRGELKTAREEELDGAKGLTPEVRTARAELFSDLSIEEQLEFKKNYKPQKFYWWLYLILTVSLPFLLVLLLEQLGAGDYLFQVVYFE